MNERIFTRYCHPNPSPSVPCLMCDDPPDQPRQNTWWRTSDGYALCAKHALEHAQSCHDADQPPTPQEAPMTTPAPTIVDPHADLARRVSELEQAIADARLAHYADIAAIGAALDAEAEARDWCDEYRDFVVALNARLRVPLPVPSVYVRARFDVEICFEAHRSDVDNIVEELVFKLGASAQLDEVLRAHVDNDTVTVNDVAVDEVTKEDRT